MPTPFLEGRSNGLYGTRFDLGAHRPAELAHNTGNATSIPKIAIIRAAISLPAGVVPSHFLNVTDMNLIQDSLTK
jgi:hypothetical protein